MKLILTNPRGFCAGVVRAIDIVEKALKIWGAPIYVKHEIVHNQHVVDGLRKKGAIFIEDIDQVPEGSKLIYSAHGVSPLVREQAKQKKLYEVDATCPLVTRVHSAVKRYADRGHKIILIGHKNHVEIVGTAGEAPDQTYIVESTQDVMELPFGNSDKLFYITQTTLSLEDVKEIREALIQRFPHIETLPCSSICYATSNRQLALKEVADQAQLVMVIGDKQSSNTNRLRELSASKGIRSELLNCSTEIKQEWLDGVKTIVLTAGASTPESIVQNCIDRLMKMGVSSIEELTYAQENVSFGLPKEIQRELTMNEV